MNVNPAIVRIGLRYLAGVLVAYGYVSVSHKNFVDDPVVVEAACAAVGFVMTIATEWYYARAKRDGDAKKL